MLVSGFWLIWVEVSPPFDSPMTPHPWVLSPMGAAAPGITWSVNCWRLYPFLVLNVPCVVSKNKTSRFVVLMLFHHVPSLPSKCVVCSVTCAHSWPTPPADGLRSAWPAQNDSHHPQFVLKILCTLWWTNKKLWKDPPCYSWENPLFQWPF